MPTHAQQWFGLAMIICVAGCAGMFVMGGLKHVAEGAATGGVVILGIGAIVAGFLVMVLDD